MAPARRDRHEAAPVEFGVDVELLVAGVERLRVGRHPHLHEVDVGARAGVHLRVPDAGPRGHALGEAGIELTRVALGVGVLEPPIEHPRHDLHVAVGVGREAGAGPHDVVVVDEEQPVPDVGRIVVVAEAEAVV